MARYTERLTYLGFTAMCLCQRFDLTIPAAFLHDFTCLILAFGCFIEGVRATQIPLVATLLLT